MRFATLLIGDREQATVRVDEEHWAPLDRIRPEFTGDLLVLIRAGLPTTDLGDLLAEARQLPADRLIPDAEARFRAPYRHPRMIWGIGLNYGRHARDLDEATPEEPASFIKGDHTVIGHGEDIVLPAESEKVTAEAEIGLIMAASAARSAPIGMADVFGVCPILDQTAEDILRRNPRYLTRSKNFRTFFSFGPEVVTVDELSGGELESVRISTIVDDTVIATDTAANMTYTPAELLAFHGPWLHLEAGDIISTGTPGAGHIKAGSQARAEIGGLRTLTNPVVQGK